MDFKQLDIPQDIIQNLEKKNICTPTEVQEKAIPLVLEGCDVIIRSKTGSGKTIAFLIPIIMRLKKTKLPQAIILTPTRELAVQIFNDAKTLTKNARSAVLYGGVSIEPQINVLRNGVDIVIGTPGRVLDHLSRGTLNISEISFVVLDEADRMLDMGFIDDIRKILSQIPEEKQTLLFSATVPEEIVKLSATFMHQPKILMLEEDEITVKTVSQKCIGLDRTQKFRTLLNLLKSENISRGIVFCNTKSWTESLGNLLYRHGVSVGVIHSGLSQNKRLYIIDGFKQGRFSILVATDVAARGLHIENVTHVINYDLPKNPKDYIHRIGRTGRAGKNGKAISFMTNIDEPLLRNIEREINMFLEVTTIGSNEVPIKKVAATNDDWGKFD